MDNSIGNDKTMGSGPDHSGGGYALQAGDVLGQYRVIRPLGKGGMGEVYLAENTLMRKQIALKLLPRAATGGTFIDRFRIEARVMADLHHPNIVQVHHAGEENGQYYLTMDYVCSSSGEPQTLEDDLSVRGKLPEAEVKHFSLQICDALALAHGRELVHRDLKPSNILIASDGNLKITDFGLAKVVGEDYLRTMIDRSLGLSMAGELSMGDEQTKIPGSGNARRSSASAILGTYDYMAPEQKAGGAITPQTDLYAVGIILYRLLTGQKPEGMFEMPSELGCSTEWDGIVRQCMQNKPDRRPESVAVLRALLEKISAESLVETDNRTVCAIEEEAAKNAIHEEKVDATSLSRSAVREKNGEGVASTVKDESEKQEWLGDPDVPSEKKPGTKWAVALVLLTVVGGGAYLVSRKGGNDSPSRLQADVETYQIMNVEPKSPRPEVTASQSSSRAKQSVEIISGTGETIFGNKLESGWKEVSSSSALRIASFSIDGTAIDFYIIRLSLGDFPSNINRWRGQVGLKPSSAEVIMKEAVSLVSDGHKVNYTEIFNKETNKGIIGAIADLSPDYYFFTAKGSVDELEANSGAIRKFIQTIKRWPEATP